MKLTERKSNLAKLLAKENIVVTQGNMKTAYFDVKNRVLGLPTWKNRADRADAVYDMLIGHEVGHALYTPEDAHARYEKACPSAPFDVCNIVEDIRIERLIKAAYPGLPRLFNTAYSELVEADFFGIANKDIKKLNFLDRLNLRGKVGDLLEVPLDAHEETIYQKCLAAETFEEVLEICIEIVNANDEDENEEQSSDESNDETEENETESEDEAAMPTEDDESDSEDDGEEAETASNESEEESLESETSSDNIESEDESAETETETVENESAETTEQGDNPSEEDPKDPLTSETFKEFEQSLKDEVETPKSQGFLPLSFPRKSYIKEHIITHDVLAEQRGTVESNFRKIEDERRTNGNEEFAFNENFDVAHTALKKKTSKKVGSMVRDFERRKAAFQYSRSQEARTGVIDPTKLHSYKLTDQIFLSKSVLANAKSHGMIFLIDYSGSMNAVLADVIEQTLNLVEFCKKVGIPFDVYSFTSGYYGRYKNGDTTPSFNEVTLDNVILIHQLSSDMKKSVYNEATKNLWAQYWLRKNDLGYSLSITSDFERLGGTPLDTVLTMMHSIVADFIAKHRVQKTMFVTLTDGDSSGLDYNCDQSEWSPKIRVKANNKTYDFKPRAATKALTKIIGDIPTVSTIGFYIPSPHSQPRNLIRFKMGMNDPQKIAKEVKFMKKNGFAQFDDHDGYGTYFLIEPKLVIDDDDEFTHETSDSIADSRKAQNKLAKEFSKHHGGAKKARVLMTRIAEKIA